MTSPDFKSGAPKKPSFIEGLQIAVDNLEMSQDEARVEIERCVSGVVEDLRVNHGVETLEDAAEHLWAAHQNGMDESIAERVLSRFE